MRVIATARGYDGIMIREPGDEFEMPDNSFDRRERKFAGPWGPGFAAPGYVAPARTPLAAGDPKATPKRGQPDYDPQGQFYDPPSWFKPVKGDRKVALSPKDAAAEAKVAQAVLREANARLAQSPGDSKLQVIAEEARRDAEAANARAASAAASPRYDPQTGRLLPGATGSGPNLFDPVTGQRLVPEPRPEPEPARAVQDADEAAKRAEAARASGNKDLV